jgi:hypothetical protein
MTDATLLVHDLSAREVYRRAGIRITHGATLPIDLGQVHDGTYVIQLRSGTATAHGHVIVQH